MKQLGGETGVLVGLDLPSVGGGTEAGSDPHIQATESEEKHLRLRVKQQTVLAAATHTQTGTQVPGKAQQLEVGV